MIKAEIVAHSLSPQGDELISVLCTFPRIILAEVNTHRMLSKNTSSSRAIPFKKMVEAVQTNPFIPIAWQKHHSGMQGSDYFNVEESKINRKVWLEARDSAIENAQQIHNYEITKQLANRLLEPFMWTTMLITGSKEGWDNFFNLRCPRYDVGNGEFVKSKKEVIEIHGTPEDNHVYWNALDWLKVNKGQAEIHIMDLAEKIYDAVNESTPRQLKAGEWHIPFNDKIDYMELGESSAEYYINNPTELVNPTMWAVKVSTAMAARTSYTVVGDEKGINYSKMIELHDRLITQDPPHSSPMEHCAKAMSDEEYNSNIKGYVSYEGSTIEEESIYIPSKQSKGWCRNFKGFIPYRHIIENKNDEK